MTEMTMTPKEVDTKIAAIMAKADPFWRKASEARSSLNKYTKAGGFEKSVARYKEELAKAVAKAQEIEREADPFEAEFKRRGGWSRFFLCVSDGGHIHRRHCQTLRPTTRIGWLPEMSGKTEEEAVTEYGIQMCTICFPSAPTMPGYIKAQVEARKAEAEKAKTLCPGSGTTDHDHSRMRFAFFKGGVCKHCEHMIGASSLGKMRKHTPEGKEPPKVPKAARAV